MPRSGLSLSPTWSLTVERDFARVGGWTLTQTLVPRLEISIPSATRVDEFHVVSF